VLCFAASKADRPAELLARLDRAGLQAGKRVALGAKRNITDFALWQTQAAHGTRLANFWIHGHFLTLNADSKMSKSSGDFVRLQTLRSRNIDPLAYRYLCMTAHYRSKLHFSWASLGAAQTALNRLRHLYSGWPDGGRINPDFAARFSAELNDDLNLPRALAVLWELVKSDLPPATLKATVDSFDFVLGLGLRDWNPVASDIPESIRVLLGERAQSREAKNWAKADEIRKMLNTRGWRVVDGNDGQRLTEIAMPPGRHRKLVVTALTPSQFPMKRAKIWMAAFARGVSSHTRFSQNTSDSTLAH